MAWIFLEGTDRSGKTTLAKMYQKQGYALVHLSAPDKKYSQAGYTGPSYADEMLDIYMKHNSGDAVFDRTPYGECVWPLVYGRKSQLSEEDFEILKEIEDNNQTEYHLMYDPNVEAHWKRCVENKEPLNKNQFNQANLLFDRMATKYGFKKLKLEDVLNDVTSGYVAPVMTDDERKRFEASMKPIVTVTNAIKDGETVSFQSTSSFPPGSLVATKSPEQMKLEKANAINDILSKRIIKQKGPLFDEVENDVRSYLNSRLGTILGNGTVTGNLSKEEVDILKVYCQQIKKKMETK